MEIQNLNEDIVEQIEFCIHAPWGESRICRCGVDGVAEEEEEILLRTVSYINNEFILNAIQDEGNATTARMLMELPRCETTCDKTMTRDLTRDLSKLKKKKKRLQKFRDAEGTTKFRDFLAEEFSFPPTTKNQRYWVLVGFLDATTNLYKRVRPSVRPLPCPSVGYRLHEIG